MQRWLVKEWKDKFLESMQDSRVGELGYIDMNALTKSFEEAEKTGWASRQLWFIFVLENWLRREQI